MVTRFKFNNKTKSFGFLSDLLSDKHIVIVLVDIKSSVIIELHQKAILGLRLSEYVTKLNKALGLNFTISKQFNLNNNADRISYEKFRNQMYETFG